MPTTDGDLSDVIMALYGDFSSAATLGDRRGFSLQVLVERYAEFRQIGVIATERFDFIAHDLGTATVAGPVIGFKGN
jgi:HK97 family phage major capsid protein